MKNVSFFLVIICSLFFSGCQVIGDIFKAGMGFGIFLVIAVIGIVIFIVAKLFGGR